MTPIAPPGLERDRLKVLYEWAEQRYLESLPLEHFMEATPHATQRKITLESFDLIRVSRPDIQCFNELLVQYPRPGQTPDKPGQVVPDNMVVVHSEPIDALGNFGTPFQPVGPLLVLEYVSKNSKQKDYHDNFIKYEQELHVPYYLLFDQDADDVTLFRLTRGKYLSVKPNEQGRFAIPELELEAALHEGWMRFWFRGKLLPLPGDLLVELNAIRKSLTSTKKELTSTKKELTSTKKELTSTQAQLSVSQNAIETERKAREALEKAFEAQKQALEAELARLREELARGKPQS